MIRDGILRYGLPAAFVIAAVIIVLVLLRSKKRLRTIYVGCILAAAAVALFLMKSELDRKIGLSDYFAAQFF